MGQSLFLQSILLLFLAVLTYYDLKYKKIPAWLLLLMAVTGMIYVIKIGDYKNLSRYMGILVGLVFFALALLSHEAIGKGDALLFLILGWFLGMYQTIFLLFVAFFLSAVFAGFLLLIKKGNFKTSLPFLPFLYIAFGGICLL